MIGTAHGPADACRMLVPTSQAHGSVPAAATATPTVTARTTTGNRCQTSAAKAGRTAFIEPSPVEP